MLSELEERLSRITRWQFVPTIQKQTVSDHSYRVCLLAIRIARKWFGITHPADLFAISEMALHHDELESLLGDIASTAKHYIDETQMMYDYNQLLWSGDVGEYVTDVDNTRNEMIVKIADKMDACLFMASELALGNRSVGHVYKDLWEKLVEFMTNAGLQKTISDAMKIMSERETRSTPVYRGVGDNYEAP